MTQLWKSVIRKLLRLDEDYRSVVAHPPGHFYSPLITPRYFRENEHACLDPDGTQWQHVNLNPEGQRRSLTRMAEMTVPEFPDTQANDWRYYSNNDYYGYGSAAILFGMMRLYKPQRIMEVGSGFSSAAMLDVAEREGMGTQFTFIEPYADRLKSLLRSDDRSRVRVVEQPVQRVDGEEFQRLEAGDILLIDSSHVAKAGSDVVDLFFRVIPSVKPGVIIHFHDIFYPHTYPRDWQLRAISWNETFIVRAFLMFNHAYRIVFFNQWAQHFLAAELNAWNPRIAESNMSSIWIQRLE